MNGIFCVDSIIVERQDTYKILLSQITMVVKYQKRCNTCGLNNNNYLPFHQNNPPPVEVVKNFLAHGVISEDNGRYIDENQLSVILLIFPLLGHCAVVTCKCLFEESCRERGLDKSLVVLVFSRNETGDFLQNTFLASEKFA